MNEKRKNLFIIVNYIKSLNETIKTTLGFLKKIRISYESTHQKKKNNDDESLKIVPGSRRNVKRRTHQQLDDSAEMRYINGIYSLTAMLSTENIELLQKELPNPINSGDFTWWEMIKTMLELEEEICKKMDAKEVRQWFGIFKMVLVQYSLKNKKVYKGRKLLGEAHSLMKELKL